MSTLYLLPLKNTDDGTYISAMNKDISGCDMALVSELEDYLSLHYKESEAERIVEIQGKRYTSIVLEPRHSDDYSYVIVTGDGIPASEISSENLSAISTSLPVEYLAAKIDYSEALSPGESIYIPNSFLEPEFEELKPSGEHLRNVQWSEVHYMPRLVIVGSPGAGKTTALRMLAIQQADRFNDSENSPLPIYIQLRNIEKGVGVVEELLRAGLTCDRETELPLPPISFPTSRVNLILDGLDEAPPSCRELLVNSISLLSEQCPTLSIILSTREAGYSWWLSGFRHIRIKPFSVSKIEEWSHYRLKAEPPISWKTFISNLRQREELLEIAGNPLFLSLATNLYRRNSTLPQNRTALLNSYFDAVVEQWDSARGVLRQSESWAAPARKTAALCRTAYGTITSNKNSFTRTEFLDWNSKFGATESLLYSCERDTGVVTSDASGENWFFTHQIIADYLTAKYVVYHTGDATAALSLISDERDWADIWSYACGIAQDASDLVFSILKSKRISRAIKLKALSLAFEQDLIVSSGATKASIEFIKEEIQRIIKPDVTSIRSKTDEGGNHMVWIVFDVSFPSSKNVKNPTIEKTHALIESLQKLGAGSLGAELREWLTGYEKFNYQSLATLLKFDGNISFKNKKYRNGKNYEIVAISEQYILPE